MNGNITKNSQTKTNWNTGVWGAEEEENGRVLPARSNWARWRVGAGETAAKVG